MRSHNDSIDTTHTPPPLSFYNTFNPISGMDKKQDLGAGQTSRIRNTEIIQSPDWSGGSGGIIPGASGHRDPAVLCATLPDADNLSLHVLLAAEGAHVLRVLRDLHLLHSLTQGGAVPTQRKGWKKPFLCIRISQDQSVYKTRIRSIRPTIVRKGFWRTSKKNRYQKKSSNSYRTI